MSLVKKKQDDIFAVVRQLEMRSQRHAKLGKKCKWLWWRQDNCQLSRQLNTLACNASLTWLYRKPHKKPCWIFIYTLDFPPAYYYVVLAFFVLLWKHATTILIVTEAKNSKNHFRFLPSLKMHVNQNHAKQRITYRCCARPKASGYTSLHNRQQ